MKKITVIDLFSGAGGFSEGFIQTGKFEFLAHIEWEKPMVNTLRKNLIDRWGYSEDEAIQSVIHFDIQKTNELINGNWSDETIKKYKDSNSQLIVNNGLNCILKNGSVDLIIWGPPCQAYSLAGRAQDANSMQYDYRNYLFESFVRIVEQYQPKLFVFENVPGILSAAPGGKLVIESIYEAFSKIGYEIKSPSEMKSAIYSSADFGVPQERQRVIIIGVRKNLGLKLDDLYKSLDSFKSYGNKSTVRDAISQLPKFKPLEQPYKIGRKNISHVAIQDNNVDLHYARYHNQRDIKAFKYWLENSMNKAPNNQKLDFYKTVTGKTTNHNKYRSLEWDKPSPTIVAHLYKDGLMFIHPDEEQLRSITIREAALLQTFPIGYRFVGSDAHCFKMIGNAVPVLFAKKIAQSIYSILEKGINVE